MLSENAPHLERLWGLKLSLHASMLLLPARRLRRPAYGLICLACRHRQIHVPSQGAQDEIPKSKRNKHEPKPLVRAIGWHEPPRAGENSGVDPRSWRQRKDDFFDHEKNKLNREQMYVFFRAFPYITIATS